MPIICTNTSHPNLTTTRGTPAHVTYIGRLSMFDPRLGKQLDFTHLANDLVYSRLWLPEGAPVEFEDIERLAIENDLAEMHRVKNLADSQRLPQIGVALITALPPDREVSLDEAKEIAWQIVHEASTRPSARRLSCYPRPRSEGAGFKKSSRPCLHINFMANWDRQDWRRRKFGEGIVTRYRSAGRLPMSRKGVKLARSDG